MTAIFPPSVTNTWIEISKSAITNNVAAFRKLVGERRLLLVVKSNAYGHGAALVARLALEAGADLLGVFAVREALELRAAGIEAPILVLGPVFEGELEAAQSANLQLTINSLATLRSILDDPLYNPQTPLHLKIETGTHRQGILAAELETAAHLIKKRGARVEGLYTHFADIEDTTDHQFAQKQLTAFNTAVTQLNGMGISPTTNHAACTAATILFPDTYFHMVRVGVGLYGLWPSKETRVSAEPLGRANLGLRPVMTWKSRITQIKTIDQGAFVGYGRTFRATRKTRLAVLPVGYADGYSRAFSNTAHVLVHGMRAKVVGRICMNLSMIDITDIPAAQINSEVILLGQAGDESVSAEDLAAIAGTINYEIVTRAAPLAQRLECP